MDGWRSHSGSKTVITLSAFHTHKNEKKNQFLLVSRTFVFENNILKKSLQRNTVQNFFHIIQRKGILLRASQVACSFSQPDPHHLGSSHCFHSCVWTRFHAKDALNFGTFSISCHTQKFMSFTLPFAIRYARERPGISKPMKEESIKTSRESIAQKQKRLGFCKRSFSILHWAITR